MCVCAGVAYPVQLWSSTGQCGGQWVQSPCSTPLTLPSPPTPLSSRTPQTKQPEQSVRETHTPLSHTHTSVIKVIKINF